MSKSDGNGLYGNSGDGGARNMGKPGVGEFYPRPLGSQKEGGIISDGAPLKDPPMTDRSINTRGSYGASQDFGGSLAGVPKSAVKDGYASLGKIGEDSRSDTTDFGSRENG